jgi:hypothetical protein
MPLNLTRFPSKSDDIQDLGPLFRVTYILECYDLSDTSEAIRRLILLYHAYSVLGSNLGVIIEAELLDALMEAQISPPIPTYLPVISSDGVVLSFRALKC